MKALTPYLVFDGNCKEAMAFYQQCLGGELHEMPWEQAPDGTPPASPGRLLHAALMNGQMLLMASDGQPGEPVKQGDSVMLSLGCDSDDEVAELYARLMDGGKEVMAPHDAFWGARFAMLTDRFGNTWMLSHDRSQQQS